jgi:SAM-dependent methyltransferase
MSLSEKLRRFHAADRAWQDRCLRFTPFHPVFWAHWTLRKAIAASAPLAKGVLLDAGCGVKPYAELFADRVEAYVGLEYGPETVYRGHKADLFGDVMSLPFASESVDVILCTEVLEHLKNPQGALQEFCRVLKDGSPLLLTAPFAFPIHGERDYFRFTAKGMDALLQGAGFRLEKAKPLTGTGKTLALLINLYVIETGFFWTKWLYPVGIILRPALWVLAALINLTGGVADFFLPSEHLVFNHIYVARKRK